MRYNKVLPDEIAEIVRKIGINLSEGPEGEGGLIFLRDIELALEQQGITSERFYEHYPRIASNIKCQIAIVFLYDIALEKAKEFGIKLEMPRYKFGEDGSLQAIPIKEHLENLLNIWKKLIDDSQTGMPL